MVSDCQVRGLLLEALAFCGGDMRTIVYIDGFNLYFGCLKGTPHKWLDLQQVFHKVLSPRNTIEKIKYFTARVQPSAKNPSIHIRQEAYLQALGMHCPLVEIHHGHYLRHRIRMENANPPPNTVEVWKNEEKGSDVNLAVHLLNDSWSNAFDCAVVVSNDSDLCEAMRLVKLNHPGKTIGLVTPGAPKRKTSVELRRHADFQREIRTSAVAASQLPANIPGSTISKPAAW